MKKSISTMIALAIVTLSASAFASTPSSIELTIGVSEVYIPGGFSSTTDSFVIASGMFPNSCYRWAQPNVTHPTPAVHEVRAKANVNQGTMCLMVMIPYQKEINLGRLQSGSHTLRFVNGDGTFFERTMNVE